MLHVSLPRPFEGDLHWRFNNAPVPQFHGTGTEEEFGFAHRFYHATPNAFLGHGAASARVYVLDTPSLLTVARRGVTLDRTRAVRCGRGTLAMPEMALTMRQRCSFQRRRRPRFGPWLRCLWRQVQV